MTDDGIILNATAFKVSATEKVSTGEFENYSPHVAIEGEVARGELTPDARTELRARLLGLQKDAQEIVERAAENRVALPESEDWGVRNGDDDG